MAKETTLNEIGTMMEHVVKHMATKDDLAELRTELKGDIMATKVTVMEIQTQVNSIETQIRGMRHGKLENRVADLEEEVFGKVRD